MNFISLVVLSVASKVSWLIGACTKILLIGYTAALIMYFQNDGLAKIIGSIDGIKVKLGLEALGKAVLKMLGI